MTIDAPLREAEAMVAMLFSRVAIRAISQSKITAPTQDDFIQVLRKSLKKISQCLWKTTRPLKSVDIRRRMLMEMENVAVSQIVIERLDRTGV